MYKTNFINKLTKIVVDIFFYLGIITVISVPFITPKIIKNLNLSESLTLPTIVTLILSGVCAVYLIFQLKQIFKTLTSGNPFVIENTVYLKNMAIAAFIISIIYVYKLTYWFTPATVIIVIVFLVAGLFCLSLKDLFAQAVKFKEDNDLTI
jgi:hypothetical protein